MLVLLPDQLLIDLSRWETESNACTYRVVFVWSCSRPVLALCLQFCTGCLPAPWVGCRSTLPCLPACDWEGCLFGEENVCRRVPLVPPATAWRPGW